MYHSASIKGQCALVTGASSGIGKAIAWRLAEAGCRLILVARSKERLESLKTTLENTYSGAQIHLAVLDVRDTDKVRRLPEELPQDFKSVDILVNNAGLALGVAAAHEVKMEDVETVLATNVTGAIAFTTAFVPGMVSRNTGHIVNISSIAGHEAYQGGSLYCASKFALHAYTTAMRHDLIGTNLRVTALSPGAVETNFSVVRFGGDKSKADAVYEGIEPLVGADVADNVMYALTRPAHVQIADIVTFATLQSGPKSLARVLPKRSKL